MKASYRAMLDPLRERFFSGELTCMPLTVGKKYHKSQVRLMYVGRAVNGWNSIWQRGDAEYLTEQVFEHTQDMGVIGRGIIEYEFRGVNYKYNYNKSPFWQLCRELLRQFGIVDDWAEYVAWTNLYKVSYSEGGNPADSLKSKTIADCADILFYEIFCERPTHIVFVTDKWWISPNGLKLGGKQISDCVFTSRLGLDSAMNSGIIVSSGVASSEYFRGAGLPAPRYVVTKRPERAGISRAAHAAAICRAFSEIST